MINLILQIPAATDPSEVKDILAVDSSYFETPYRNTRREVEVLEDVVGEDGEVKEELGTKIVVDRNDVLMPNSVSKGGITIVQCVVSGTTYERILETTSEQRPVWLILGAQDLYPSPNPDYDPEDEGSPPTITVVHKALMGSVWANIKDRDEYDIDRNKTGAVERTELHNFQGASPWPLRY